MLCWLFYLRKIDIYEPEKWKHILLIFILGIIFSEFTFLLSDLNSRFTGFNLNGGVVNDLLYCIIGIGVIEELVKILPVIIILKYTRAINEPVDYLVYVTTAPLPLNVTSCIKISTLPPLGLFTSFSLINIGAVPL